MRISDWSSDVCSSELAASGVEDAYLGAVIDELEQVTVAGHHIHRHAGPGGKRADHVVGLHLVGANDGEAVRLEHVDDDRDLDEEGVGDLLDVRGGTGHLVHPGVCLVGRDQVDAPLGSHAVVPAAGGRKAGGRGKSVSERGDLGGGEYIKNNN